MAGPLAALFSSRSRWFDLGVLLAGVLVVAGSTVRLFEGGIQMDARALVCIPLIVVIAKFPMVLDRGEGGIEVGFDSSVLMFLLCTLSRPHEAVLIWAMGVLVTQMTTDKRQAVKLFNIGVGFVGGGVAAAVFFQVRADGYGTFRELLAVALAAACYFATDYLVSAVSVAIETDTAVRGHLVQRGTLFAVACFVPFDSLG
jgi:hypothetical protein